MKSEILGEIEQMINSFTPSMVENYSLIRDSNKFALHHPELDFIRKEICLCITMGAHQAAITLTNHLLEKFLKHSLIRVLSKPDITQDIQAIIDRTKKPIKDINVLKLHDTINRAHTFGIITKQEKAKLHDFRDRYRNAYGHADMKKTFEGETMTIALGSFTSKAPAEVKEVNIAEMPVLQGLRQKFKAAEESVAYFLYLDKIIIREALKNDPGLMKWQTFK